MRVGYERNAVKVGLPSVAENDIQTYCYGIDTFSFPEDEASDIKLKFWIKKDITLDIPYIVEVPFKSKNPKISISCEFALINFAESGDEVVLTYRN